MQLRTLFVLLAICSIQGSSCASAGPRVTVCIFNTENPDGTKKKPEEFTGECSDPDGNEFTLPAIQMEKYICKPREDEERLIKWCKKSKQLNLEENQ